MNRLKLLVLGPVESGKSFISNFLSESVEKISGNYRPTQALRIVEYDVDLSIKGKRNKFEIELWDVSGDRKFESCWPALGREANGIIFVYNPDQSHHGKELENWHLHFGQASGIKEHQCCVISHKKPKTSDRDIVQLSDTFEKMRILRSNIEENPEQLRDDFNRYLAALVSNLFERHEQEELNIMNS